MMQGAQGMLVQNWPTVSSAAGGWKCSGAVVYKRKLYLHLMNSVSKSLGNLLLVMFTDFFLHYLLKGLLKLVSLMFFN